jgi:hypothetical protein
MKLESELRFVVESVEQQSAGVPDDLFIGCNSFEPRCLGVPGALGLKYQARFSCLFRYEANVGEKADFELRRSENFAQLTDKVASHTIEAVFPIQCNRQDVGDGMGQFRSLFRDFLVHQRCESVTIDITCFTKLYLFELLHYLCEELNLQKVRVAYTQPRAYGIANLTEGIGEIFYIPHFGGSFQPNRETVLIVFLGFETERALGIWEHYEPYKTIVVLADPPMREGYLVRAKNKNAFLLSRPAVSKVTMNPYDPRAISAGLEELYLTKCTDSGHEQYNVAVISLGTKVQCLGLFDFWRRHRSVRITYAFPREYGSGYSNREPGNVMLFDFPLQRS